MRRYILIVAVAALAACNKDDASPLAAPGAGFQRLPADQIIIGFQQYVSEGGKKNADVLGDTAYIYEDSAIAKIRGANLVLYDETGALKARVKARTGDVNSVTQAMIARGNVVLVTNDGRRIETEELHYDPTNHRIFSNVTTTQHFQGGILRGTGFDADDKFYNVRIIGATSSGGGFKIPF